MFSLRFYFEIGAGTIATTWKRKKREREKNRIEEVLLSDTDRWRKRAKVERNAPTGFRASVSRSLDADSEEPTIVPRRLVPVSEESTVVLYTVAERHLWECERHSARKSPIKLAHSKQNKSRPHCKGETHIAMHLVAKT